MSESNRTLTGLGTTAQASDRRSSTSFRTNVGAARGIYDRSKPKTPCTLPRPLTIYKLTIFRGPADGLHALHDGFPVGVDRRHLGLAQDTRGIGAEPVLFERKVHLPGVVVRQVEPVGGITRRELVEPAVGPGGGGVVSHTETAQNIFTYTLERGALHLEAIFPFCGIQACLQSTVHYLKTWICVYVFEATMKGWKRPAERQRQHETTMVA